MQTRPDALLEPLAVWGGGFQELVPGTSPAAGADFTQLIDGRYTTRPLSVFARLVTDGNAANRELVLEYRNDQNVRFAVAGAPVTVAASTTTDYYFGTHLGQPDWPADSTILVPLAPVFLRAGWNLRLHVVSAQAGDQLSRISILWERYSTDGPT